MKTVTRLQILLLSTLLLPALAAAAGSKDSFEQTLTAPDAMRLEVVTGSGSINISSGTGRSVTVVGKVHVSKRGWFRKAANEEEILQAILDNPPVELSGNRLKVGHIADRGLRNSVSISYEIVVPADTEVEAKAGSGSISVNDIAASAVASAGSGELNLRNIGGSVRASAGSGSIRAEQVAGAFNGNTGSGSVFLSQTAPGDVSVSTGSGTIELTGIVGSLQASAGSGRIRVEGRQAGDWTLDAGSGSVRVSLPDDAAFDLDAESNSGSIVVDHPMMVEGEISRRHVRGVVRGGGPRLRIDTGSGSIHIE